MEVCGMLVAAVQWHIVMVVLGRLRSSSGAGCRAAGGTVFPSPNWTSAVSGFLVGYWLLDGCHVECWTAVDVAVVVSGRNRRALD